MNEEETKQSLNGTVIFQRTNAGSKSDSLQPFLYVNCNQVVPLYMNNSNPFENAELKDYDGTLVTATGIINNNTLRIESISKVKE